jgi:hypothetical protein
MSLQCCGDYGLLFKFATLNESITHLRVSMNEKKNCWLHNEREIVLLQLQARATRKVCPFGTAERTKTTQTDDYNESRR